VISASFVLSAASASDFPATGLPEIALVGRSNVGKSSLINALVQKTIARTSAAPGKTRLANFYLVENFYLVDLPGYGYARGGEDAAREFELLSAAYFRLEAGSRRRLAGILHLIDARHPDLQPDADAHDWLQRTALPIAIVATKIDKLTRAERTSHLQALENDYDTAILPVSAPAHQGFDAIWKAIRSWTARP